MQINLVQTNPFWAAVDRLPSAQKSKVIRFLQQYPGNPRSSGFNFEKIQLGSTDKMRSVRLDKKYRIIAHQEKNNNTITCLHVDVHDAAYTWAKTHRFEKRYYREYCGWSSKPPWKKRIALRKFLNFLYPLPTVLTS